MSYLQRPVGFWHALIVSALVGFALLGSMVAYQSHRIQAEIPVQPAYVRTTLSEEDVKFYRAVRPSACMFVARSDGKEYWHGSGLVVEVKGKKYVLTAGHVVWLKDKDPKDMRFFAVWEKGVEVELKIIRDCKPVDLAFLVPVDSSVELPKGFAIIPTTPQIGEDVWIIGAPLWFKSGILGSGKIIGYEDNEMIASFGIAPGDSGAAVMIKHGDTYAVCGVVVAVPQDWSMGNKYEHLGICVSSLDLRLEAAKL